MVAMKDAIAETTPLFVAAIRLLPAGVLVLLAAMAMDRPQPRSWRGWGWILLFALVDGVMFQGFLAIGLTHTGAGIGSVIIDSQPLAVALMSRYLFGEIIGTWGWLGLSLGLFGIALIGLPDAWLVSGLHGTSEISFSWQDLWLSGEWWMLLASLSMALGTISIRYVCRHVDAVAATGWHMVLAGIPLFVLAFVGGNPVAHLSVKSVLGLGYASVFGSAIAYGIFFYLASRVNLTSFSALTFLTPVFALLFGNVLLAERLTSIEWVGAGMSLVAIYLINQRESLGEKIESWLSRWRDRSKVKEESKAIATEKES